VTVSTCLQKVVMYGWSAWKLATWAVCGRRVIYARQAGLGNTTADPKSPLRCAVFWILSTFCTQCPIGAYSTGDSALRFRAKQGVAQLRRTTKRWPTASGLCTGAALCPTRRSPMAVYQSWNGIINYGTFSFSDASVTALV
jgi:hypothetical protein